MLTTAFIIIQFIFTIVTGIYFWTQLRNQQETHICINADSKKELERLNNLRRISLTKPLTEKARPECFDEIVGQEDGIQALKIALCTSNPQHVIIYGPPGVGKTTAARAALKEAVKLGMSPFAPDAKFVETDATTMRFDERSIADPLIGSVHDPIYQGAGAYGQAGVPQPKEGAVSKAHGGILFIDEIGELHPMQLNKLLKVLEDRKVMFESAYYSAENKNIPKHIHDIFQNGIPADFRLVGATTRRPEEIPEAVRSRCVEVFFRSLDENDLKTIVKNVSEKLMMDISDESKNYICRYAKNGRDAVRILQTAAGAAMLDKREFVTIQDVERVIEFGCYTPNYSYTIPKGERVGSVNALAVSGNTGMVMTVEVSAEYSEKPCGKVKCTGIIESETMQQGVHKFTRTSTAKSAVENVMTVLENRFSFNISHYNIHINFSGGIPVDGPSAGAAVLCGVYSAVTKIPIPNDIAITGEVSIKGDILPVGGVVQKITAAKCAGAKTVYIPADNMQTTFSDMGIKVVPVKNVDDITAVLRNPADETKQGIAAATSGNVAAACEYKKSN